MSASGSRNSRGLRGASWEEASQTPPLQYPQLQHVPRLGVRLWVNTSSLVGQKSVSIENLPRSWPRLVLLLDMESVSTENLPGSQPLLVPM